MLVGLKRISTALGLLAASAAVAEAQGTAPTGNQGTANAVATSLRQSPTLSRYRIEIETRNGVVSLTGAVATPAQRAEALARARMVPGVKTVSDHIAVAGDRNVRPVRYQSPQAGMYGQNTGMGVGGGEVIYNGPTSMPGQPGGVYSGPTTITSQPTTMMGGMNGMGGMGGPMPEGPAGMPGASQASQPNLPNYSWPSYAPYPNFSAVGYPTVYPWQAWPNIAAPYPYPEVPLDWRAVTLRWDDGIWWLDFKKNYTRPFFTPYPFGIKAY
jgi:hypothetical protein